MSKYEFILYSRSFQEFLDRLRKLSLVDISTTGWESSDAERDIILEIEARTKAEAALTAFAASPEFVTSAAATAACDVYSRYVQIDAERKELISQIAQMEKTAEEVLPWGEFSAAALEALEAQGIAINCFVANDSAFEKGAEQWAEQWAVELINSYEGNSYFVVIAPQGTEVMIDAQQLKRPTLTSSEAEREAKELGTKLSQTALALSSCAQNIEAIEAERIELIAKLQSSKVRSTATEAADGSLLVMTAWAEESTSAQVDALLEEYPSVLYIKSQPTPEDNTPVKLTNKWFPRIFEMIGNMYALPKYGTIDLTPLFAPFYMLFFAICLCDAGYGAIILAAGLGIYFKGGKGMRQAAWLSIICGAAAVAFGLFANSFFGMSISSHPLINFQQDFFSISMMIGVFQILLGMGVNIVVTTRTFGFKYALGSLGWFLLIFSGSLSAALSACGVTAFGFSSIPFLAAVVAALVLMLFFNSPGKNLFANFGAGLWNTYNNITGLLSDVLSYIRLFAIGLSGGVLALVFNSLALGMTGLDAGIEGKPIGAVIGSIIGASVILLIGNGINLFMSTISSFVHPMRLTFVEFFKNAGFEMATRKFDPLK